MIHEITGIIVLFFSMILQVIIPPIPAEAIVIGAGKVYGIFITTIIAGTGLFIGSTIVYYFGVYLEKKFNRFFNKKKVRKIIEKIKKYENFILWIRILPFNPSDTISYAAGIMEFEKRKFIRITLVTSYVRCLTLSLLGTYIKNFETLLEVFIFLAISAFIAYAVLFRKK